MAGSTGKGSGSRSVDQFIMPPRHPMGERNRSCRKL